MKWENEVQRFYSLFILEYSFFYEWSVLGQIRSEKMKWENEVQRFYLLFILEYSFFIILEYSFFMNEVFWVKLGQ